MNLEMGMLTAVSTYYRSSQVKLDEENQSLRFQNVTYACEQLCRFLQQGIMTVMPYKGIR